MNKSCEKKGLGELAESLAAFPPQDVRFTIALQTEPLGLGHAVLCARKAVGKKSFGLMLPDTLLLPPTEGMAQLASLYGPSRPNLVMTHEVTRDRTQSYGIIDAGDNTPDRDGSILLREVVEKPSPTTAPSLSAISGRYILSPMIFDLLSDTPRNPSGEIELTDAINRLAQNEKVYAVPNPARWHDCGNKIGLTCAWIDRALQDPAMKPTVTACLRHLS